MLRDDDIEVINILCWSIWGRRKRSRIPNEVLAAVQLMNFRTIDKYSSDFKITGRLIRFITHVHVKLNFYKKRHAPMSSNIAYIGPASRLSAEEFESQKNCQIGCCAHNY